MSWVYSCTPNLALIGKHGGYAIPELSKFGQNRGISAGFRPPPMTTVYIDQSEMLKKLTPEAMIINCIIILSLLFTKAFFLCTHC